MKKTLFAVLMTTALPSLAYFPLETDDTGTQGRGGWQFETTYEYSDDLADGQNTETRSFGVGLAYGLSETLDISLGLGHERAAVAGEASISGVADGELGLKWRFFERDGLSFGVAPAISLPFGDEEKGLGTGAVSYGVSALMTAELGAITLHANAGVDRSNFKREEDKVGINRNVWHASVAVDGEVTKGWRLAGEVGKSRAEEQGTQNPAFAAVALVYSPSDLLDASAGYRVAANDAETDNTLLFGLTFHW